MQPADLIEFRRSGFVSAVLGGMLRLLDPEWDGWGWHVGIAWQFHYHGWYVLESRAGGPEINWYPETWLKANTRSHRWLDFIPDEDDLSSFLNRHIGKKYDVSIYFWTAFQYLIRHFFNHRIPRLLDDRYTCWELAAEFYEELGEPLQSKYDCPMLPDMIRACKRIKE